MEEKILEIIRTGVHAETQILKTLNKSRSFFFRCSGEYFAACLQSMVTRGLITRRGCQCPERGLLPYYELPTCKDRLAGIPVPAGTDFMSVAYISKAYYAAQLGAPAEEFQRLVRNHLQLIRHGVLLAKSMRDAAWDNYTDEEAVAMAAFLRFDQELAAAERAQVSETRATPEAEASEEWKREFHLRMLAQEKNVELSKRIQELEETLRIQKLSLPEKLKLQLEALSNGE